MKFSIHVQLMSSMLNGVPYEGYVGGGGGLWQLN